MLRTSSQVLSRLCAHQIRVTASSWSQRNSRRFHDEFTTPDSLDKKARVPNAIGNKFKQFVDKDAPIILDVNEERQRIRTGLEEDNQPSEPYLDMNLERMSYKFFKDSNKYSDFAILGGKTGVFEIEELVEILKRDNAENIFVCAVPEEYKYVDYICVTTGRSTRHMIALAEFVRKMYKLKRNNDDILPKIEGRTSKDWMALDLGKPNGNLITKLSMSINIKL